MYFFVKTNWLLWKAILFHFAALTAMYTLKNVHEIKILAILPNINVMVNFCHTLAAVF
jgi:hypothetical protein